MVCLEKYSKFCISETSNPVNDDIDYGHWKFWGP